MRLTAVCALCLLVTGCHVNIGGGIQGSGNTVTDIRAVDAFSKIKLLSSADVVVEISDEQSVEVEVDDNLVDIITTEVSGETLSISSTESYSSRSGIVVRIKVAELDEVSIGGSGEIKIDGLAADDFSATVTGSGDVVASGTAKALTARVTGSGDVDCSAVKAETAEARVTGSGDVAVSASQSVKANITGSGDIVYSGHSGKNPDVDTSVMGSGDIHKK